ncbi:hypothetical protein FRB94_001603 [Tulasnella sp. JGI-2019a]|nr:hypothetical protein FRB94_001603 [Tulasnella sp. JGI-2019a]
MSWMPFIATALTIAEVSQDDEDMCSTDRNALRELAEGLREYRQQGLRLKAEVESVKVTEGEIIALQLKLQAIAQFLSPLKVCTGCSPLLYEVPEPDFDWGHADQHRALYPGRPRGLRAQ